MELEQLVTLIKTVSASELTNFKYEEKGIKISMGKEEKQVIVERTAEGAGSTVFPVTVKAAAGELSAPSREEKGEPSENAGAEGNIVTSPLVGTFYAAPSEDANPFVAVGDTVKPGQTLAIVEAMKLMNEIECEFDGRITEIYVANGEAVEYGQPLFCIS